LTQAALIEHNAQYDYSVYLRQKNIRALVVQEAGESLDIDLPLRNFMPDEWEPQKWHSVQKAWLERVV
jgi:hypothetical protein